MMGCDDSGSERACGGPANCQGPAHRILWGTRRDDTGRAGSKWGVGTGDLRPYGRPELAEESWVSGPERPQQEKNQFKTAEISTTLSLHVTSRWRSGHARAPFAGLGLGLGWHAQPDITRPFWSAYARCRGSHGGRQVRRHAQPSKIRTLGTFRSHGCRGSHRDQGRRWRAGPVPRKPQTRRPRKEMAR